jgi:hypothetical protein
VSACDSTGAGDRIFIFSVLWDRQRVHVAHVGIYRIGVADVEPWGEGGDVLVDPAHRRGAAFSLTVFGYQVFGHSDG